MRHGTILLLAGAVLLWACGRQESRGPAANETGVANTNARSAPTAQSANAVSNEPASLDEPNGPIEPKSAEAAGQVVQSYGALIEQKRWSEGNALWGDPSAAIGFQRQLSKFGDVHLEIGNPGDPEGAAGSIYVTVPAIFYGDSADGQPFRRSADVILRRVNDVPGSTEPQRRWHIERIDWAS